MSLRINAASCSEYFPSILFIYFFSFRSTIYGLFVFIFSFIISFFLFPLPQCIWCAGLCMYVSIFRSQYVGMALPCLISLLHLRCIVFVSYCVATELVSLQWDKESARTLDVLHVEGGSM